MQFTEDTESPGIIQVTHTRQSTEGTEIVDIPEAMQGTEIKQVNEATDDADIPEVRLKMNPKTD